jgi:uncharacterized protein
MKKTIFVLICILLLIFPVVAGGQSIVDNACLLEIEQVNKLEEQARQIEESYNIDIVILTVPSTYGVDAAVFADEYYLTNGYGNDGILLLLVMDSRDWVISTWGSVADAMSKSDCDDLFASAADHISGGDYVRGFERYLDLLPMYVDPSHPNAVPKDMPALGKIGISLLIGCAVAGIVLIVMITSMRSSRPKPSAADYLLPGTAQIHTQRDFYLYSHTTRTKIETNSGSRGGSRSHGGSRGKF